MSGAGLFINMPVAITMMIAAVFRAVLRHWEYTGWAAPMAECALSWSASQTARITVAPAKINAQTSIIRGARADARPRMRCQSAQNQMVVKVTHVKVKPRENAT